MQEFSHLSGPIGMNEIAGQRMCSIVKAFTTEKLGRLHSLRTPKFLFGFIFILTLITWGAFPLLSLASENITEGVEAQEAETTSNEAPEEEESAGFDTGELAEEEGQQEAIANWEAEALAQNRKRTRTGIGLVSGGTVLLAGAAYATVLGMGWSDDRAGAASLCADLNDPNSSACQDARAYSKKASQHYAMGAALGIAGLALSSVGTYHIVIGRQHIRSQLVWTPAGGAVTLQARF